MNNETRLPLMRIPESEVLEWRDAGWDFLGADETDGFLLMEWRRGGAAKHPAADIEFPHVARAVASLEGRAA